MFCHAVCIFEAEGLCALSWQLSDQSSIQINLRN